MTSRKHRCSDARRHLAWAGVLLAASLGLLATAACSTKAYCFADCGEGGANDLGSAGSGTGGKPGLIGSAGEGANPSLRDSGTDASGCKSEGEEVCDGRDNDCNGKIDDGIDFSEPQNCGTCSLDCSRVLLNVAVPICVPPDKLDGEHAGSCTFESCAQDYYDLDPETPGCEYFCDRNPDGTIEKDLGGEGCGRDDDCDGKIDEDLKLCSDVNNCGACGKVCQVANGSAACASEAEAGDECTEENTHCVVEACDDGYSDADGDPDNGCEYQCIADGAEKCDGKDNDCDGLIDNTDPDLESEARIGQSCWGGSQGACASAEHEGIRKCIGGQLKCCDPDSNDVAGTNPNAPENGVRNGVCEAQTGTHVLRAGELGEICNAVDDDCNGTVDDKPKDVGNACGTALGVCVVGALTCETDPDAPDYGTLVCRGATQPREEICNGEDDDCDGVVDGTLIMPVVECEDDTDCTQTDGSCLPREEGASACALPSIDSGDGCNVPKAPPEGASSGCRAGVTECRGGTLICHGAVSRDPNTPDTCGVDQNCDGALDNTNLSLLTTCGSCTNDCIARGQNAAWTCEDDGRGVYGCVEHGCKDGWYECDPDDDMVCETYCQPTGSEVCNGVDDDCDCELDEDVTADARSVCGVRSTANPGCNPAVECVDGKWQCAFSEGICGGADADCAGTADDTCDNKDNDCDGVVDNAHAEQKGTTCVNTLGQCEETGTQVCNTLTGELECNAPTPQIGTETCNGKDDDCDGDIDESYADKEAGDENYVKPDLVALGLSGPWIFAYEASRPGATAEAQGTGNGYFDIAPSGEGRDATIACSAPDRMPWTNVSPWEIEQSCEAIGGRICRPSDWETACTGSPGDCEYGFDGCQSASDYTNGPFCNLGPFQSDDDTLLPTASSELSGCAALWTGTNGNALDAYDITGNAREAVRCQKDRAVCGTSTDCTANCCSGTSTSISGPGGNRRVCGTGLGNSRALSGQPCSSGSHCCDNDTTCSADGTCQNGICRASGATSSCVARGVACTDADTDGKCDQYGSDSVSCCDKAPLSAGVCGGVTSLPHATYPLLGGSYQTDSEDGATCDYSFFKVDYGFRLYDTGFRCCFDVDPR